MKGTATNKIILLLLTFFLFFISCKKTNPATGGSGTILERYFEENVLNKNFIVNLATDNGADITAQFTNYTFKMLKTDYYHGPMNAYKDGKTYIGTWSSNADYSQLIITLPSSPSEFMFLNRSWRFTKKALPQMELAPWGSSAALVLHMYRL